MKKVNPVQNPFLTFMFVPREITLKEGKIMLRLAAIVKSTSGLNPAEVVASVKKHKSKITYTHAMKKFIRKSGYHKSDFKPLENYLLTVLKQGAKDPQVFLSLLGTYLASGQAPAFSVVFQPEPPSYLPTGGQ